MTHAPTASNNSQGTRQRGLAPHRTTLFWKPSFRKPSSRYPFSGNPSSRKPSFRKAFRHAFFQKAVAAGAAFGLATFGLCGLSGCSKSAQAADPYPDPVPVASAAPGREAVPGADAAPAASAQASASPASAGEEPSTVPTSPEGDVEATVGTPIGLAADSGNTSVFELTVNSITQQTTCPSKLDGSAVHPSKDSFLVIDLSAQMSPEYAAKDPKYPFLTLDRDVWYITNPAGVIEEGTLSVKSYECFGDAEAIQPFVNPGEAVAGKLALDTDTEHGYLHYNPFGVPGSGWRWAF